jgi:hypothetical protein
MKRSTMATTLSLALMSASAAFAQTTTPPAQGAPAPQNAPAPQSMPAPTAASPQDAARCTATAKQVIGALDKGDYASATKTFDPQLRKQLPDDKLKQGWQSLAQKYGKRSSMGQSQSQQVKDVTVIVLPMQYEKAELGAQVACSKQGTVLALQVGEMPAASPGMAPPAKPGA